MVALSRAIFVACLVAGPGLVSSAARAADLKITWEVENRFPFWQVDSRFPSFPTANLFKDYSTKHFLDYKETAITVQKTAGANWILETERKLQELHRNNSQRDRTKTQNDRDEQAWNGWASLTRDSSCWDRQDKKWTKRARCDDYFLPSAHRITAKVKNAPDGAECRWTWEVVGAGNIKSGFWPKRRSLNDDNDDLKKPIPCSKSVAVEIPYSPNGETDPKKGGFRTILRVTSGNAGAEETIQVTDLLVVGMGDSFAAGVGNPDQPARINWASKVVFENPVEKNKRDKLRAYPTRFADPYDNSGRSVAGAQAEWLDIRCFRSQYGPQFRAALHLAVSLPHASVTYIDLACNGARIIEGLLNSKTLEGGYSYNTQKNPPRSQIEAANELLCSRNKSTDRFGYELVSASTAAGCRNLGTSRICEYGDGRTKFFYQNDSSLRKTSMEVCRVTRGDRFKRPIDVLLLSIGGNDIGFAAMVADVLIDNNPGAQATFKKITDWAGISHKGSIGSARLDLLNSKYAVLNRAMSQHLPWRPGQQAPDQKKPVFLTAYPIPLDDSHGQRCGTTRENARAAGTAFNVSKFFENFGAEDKKQVNRRDLTTRMKEVRVASCALNLRRFEWMDGGPSGGKISEDLTKNGEICGNFSKEDREKLKAKPGDIQIPWHFVGDFLPAYKGRGFCAHKEHLDELAIPEKEGGNWDRTWEPNYKDAAPYLSRDRWLRTPNDAFVITNWHLGHYKVDDYANLLIAATTTSMHPTAEGFAAMADGILGRVTTYLCKENPLLKNEEVCRTTPPNLQISAAP